MLRFKNGDKSLMMLELVGLCGEFPVALVRKLDGYYDYNRRLVTELVREGYLKERKFQGYRRRIVRSLSLTEKGLSKLRHLNPGSARQIGRHLLAPANGQGDWKKTLRLHRNAACLLAAEKLGAVWRPGKQKEALLGKELVYYSAYEIRKLFGRDDKGARLSGVFFCRWFYYPVYYLGEYNMQFSEENELMFRRQLEGTSLGECFIYGANMLLGESWDLAENLVQHGINPRSRLIHTSREHIFHYSVFDSYGLRLMRLAMDSMLRSSFRHYLYKNGAADSMYDEYLCSLDCLSLFYVPKNKMPDYRGPTTGYFFDFQMEAMKMLCNTGAKLLCISSRWLDTFAWEDKWKNE